MKQDVSVIITDLDNTLFDWVKQWHASFSAMLEKMIEISGVEREELISEIKRVHQAHGTAEYAFLIESIPLLNRDGLSRGDLINKYDDAIHAHRSARKRTLALYAGVRDTLIHLKNQGTLIIGYTESMAFYSSYRVRKLGLDGLLDYLYSPEDHELPKGLTADEIRMHPKSSYEYETTIHKYTPKGELKPNPRLLLDIISDQNCDIGDAVYVGDNLYKDVEMAQKAGVTDVHAKYGTAHTRDEYQLLIDVTFWTDEDVAREKALKEHDVKPTFTLNNGYAELLSLFNFTSHGG